MCYHEKNVPSRLSPQWLCGNPCTCQLMSIYADEYTWHPNNIFPITHKPIMVITGRTHCFHDNIYYAHLASMRFEHSVCRGSLMTIYIYIYNII